MLQRDKNIGWFLNVHFVVEMGFRSMTSRNLLVFPLMCVFKLMIIV